MQTFSIFDIFNLCAGLAIFLYGMQQGEKNLKRIGGNSLQKIINIITKHRLSAYMAGFSITMVTQSSSATTVMLVGLASAHLMTLGQSLGMILGSDLATTFTVSLFAFKFYQIAPFFIAFGYLISLVSNSNMISGTGKLLFALGFIFYGMHMMADSVTPLHNSPLFQGMISASFSNNWYGLIAGTVITAIIHSSAATLAIVITLAQNYQEMNGHTLTLVQLFPIVLGANLGTCATALISTIRADLEGTRVACAHFFFKFLGILIVFPFAKLIYLAEPYLHFSTPLQIAILHTIFNIIISLLFLPFLGSFEKLILLLVKPRKKKTQPLFHLAYLSEEVLNLPVLALSQSAKEISRMAEIVTLMLEKSLKLINHFDNKIFQEVSKLDDEVDFLHEKLVAYVTRIARQELDAEQTSLVYTYIMITADIEHIGDTVSKSIIYLLQKTDLGTAHMSVDGRKEIDRFYSCAYTNFKEVMNAFSLKDKAAAEVILTRKASLKLLFNQMFEHHMERLYIGKSESLQTTSIHKDLLEEIQRINHYTLRIANAFVNNHQHSNFDEMTQSNQEEMTSANTDTI